MSDKITIVQRVPPVLVSPGDDLYEWYEAVRLKAEPTLVQRVKLWFRPWKCVLAPEGTPCQITTLSGRPIFRYKELDGFVFYLGPELSPGFPGS